MDIGNIEEGKWPEDNEVRHHSITETIQNVGSPPSDDETDANATKRMEQPPMGKPQNGGKRETDEDGL